MILKSNKNYAVDEVVDFVSILHSDLYGLGSYQLAIDVTPSVGKSVMSGSTGGVSTASAWGFGGDGRASTQERLFWVSTQDWVSVDKIWGTNCINST